MLSQSAVRRKMGRRLLSAAVIGTLALGGVVSTATSAQAFPARCTTAFVANGGTAMCNGGSGHVRVVLGCKNIFGFWTNPTGPWVKVGNGASRTGCPFGYGVQWVGFYGKG